MKCVAPNCTRQASPSEEFCGRHWKQRCDRKAFRRFQCAFAKDAFGLYLLSLFEQRVDETNQLQPKLPAFQKKLPHIRARNLLVLWQRSQQYLPLLLAFLQPHLKNGDEGVKVRDQRIRAEKLAELLQPEHTEVRMMDGHGRFLLLFLQAVVDRHGEDRLQALTIELVDNDEQVTNWHRSVYRCRALRCTTADILDPQYAAPLSTLVYLNFCGVGSDQQWTGIRLFVQSAKSVFMLSCSTARAAKRKVAEAIGRLNRGEDHSFEKISNRSDFVTYVVKIQNAPHRKGRSRKSRPARS